MSMYEFTDANGRRLRIVLGWGSMVCNQANLFGNPFAAKAFIEALEPDTRHAISKQFMDAFRDQPRHINGPLHAPAFGGRRDPNQTLLTPEAKLTRAIANSELVVQLDTSLTPVDDNRAELRMKIRMALNTLLADERREAAMYQAQMDKESTFTKGLIYTGAFFHGLGNAAWDTLKWAKEVSDLGNPLVQMRNMFNAAYDAYGEDKVVEAFAKNLQAAHWREIVEALGFDPSQISREMIAQAMDAANVVWEDKTLRQDLTTFAKDYIKAQHAVELTNLGGGAALEVVITAILAALTAGAGLAIATAAKARHLPKLRKLGDLLLEFAEQSKKLARYLKEKAKRAAKGKPDKPLDTEPVVERVNEPPRGVNRLTKVEVDKARISELSEEARKAELRGDDDGYNLFIGEAREILSPYVDNNQIDEVLARLDVDSPKDGAFFWSGYPDGALDAAKEQAAKAGGVSLESTFGGRVVNDWDALNNSEMSGEFWSRLSENYASSAKGYVRAIQSDGAFANGGGYVWKNTEIVKLSELNNVNRIDILDLNGGVRQTLDKKAIDELAKILPGT